MAIDIRATITCSLGTLISGSISDDYLQGSGLVKTKGSVEIRGTITPAIGTTVTFSYVKGGVTRSIPRKLRVMSSFADPFRRTTKVELGCKLTYLSDLKDRVQWRAFDDPENDEATEVDAKIVTLPIFASSLMMECLFNLGITASSIPLFSAFSIPEFDFSAGYVQILSDLLVSESYFGYLDTNEVLQVRSLDVDAGTGPVFTSADIVDLGPIGVGQLPGEAVTVSYSTLVLKKDIEVTDPEAPPDPEAEEEAAEKTEELKKVNWEFEETIGAPTFIEIEANVFEKGFISTFFKKKFRFDYIPRTTVETEYDDWDRMKKRTTTSYTIGIAINTTYFIDRYAPFTAESAVFGGAPISSDEWAESEQVITEIETPEYAVRSTGNEEKPQNYDEVISNTIIKIEPKMAVLGAAAISTRYVTSENLPGVGGPVQGTTITEVIKSTYKTGTKSLPGQYATVPVVESTTTKSLAYAYTQAGQQKLSAQFPPIATTPGEVPVAYSDAFALVDQGTETVTRTGRESVLQSRPSSADRKNAEYNKDKKEEDTATDGNTATSTATSTDSKASAGSNWRTESKAELELALGSPAAQRRIEFSLPYAPDDRFIRTGIAPLTYTSVRSNAAAVANRYGRVQNRLLLGNRTGINLQLSPERLPASPFEPLYVQANGLTAQYRANGTSWAFDSNGIVASVDALFWSAVGGTGTFWFPVAPGITTLPTTPAIISGTMTPTTVVLPYNETAVYAARLRLVAVVTKFDYSLTLLTVVPVMATKVKVGAARIFKVEVPAASITVAAAVPAISTGAVVVCSAIDITVTASVPSISV